MIFGAMKKYGYMRIIHLGKSQILTIKVKNSIVVAIILRENHVRQRIHLEVGNHY